jgi:drug/metabolite transporter (DMT)-like permease
MSNVVAAAILFAALLHAGWNALIKRDQDVLIATIGVVVGAALISSCFLPWLPAPDAASWPFIAASSVVQIAYYILIARIYGQSDLGLAYPVMRGSAPLFVTIANALLFGQLLSPPGLLGVVCISAGIFVIAGGRFRGTDPGATIRAALAIGLVIALYTVIDGIGVRRSHAPAAYTMWIFLFGGMSMGGWAMIWRRNQILHSIRTTWWVPIGGGASTLASYGIALWAMTRAPIAAVAALRETSILFAILISIFALREKPTGRRITAAFLLAVGAVAIRLS